MDPIVRYMILSDDVREEVDQPGCWHVDCLMSGIVSLETPPYPLVRELICVFVALTECRGKGTIQIRVAFADETPERPLFGSAAHPVDFANVGPLEVVGIPFRIRACRFPSAGSYAVQLWYNGKKFDERPLRLR